MGALPPVFIEFLGSATGFHSTARGVKAELAAIEKQGSSSFQQLMSISKFAFLGVAAGAVVAGAHMVHMAADFETAMTRVRTGAGESAENMKMVGDGVLRMAGEVGQSTEHLTTGLYMVESAGYHGADALNLLKVSAMGAKVGAAELGSVTDAVTTAMNAYGLKTNDVAKTQQNATDVMNALIGTEAEGKTNMEALAGSMASILPVASAAKVGLNEILGAMATMTAQGTSADVAATYLRQTIGQLSNPSGKAAQEMKSLGLSSVEVSKSLGTNGLAATLTMLTDAIQSKMGPAGTVLIEHLQKASSNANDFEKVLANIPPAQQTYIGALAQMVGGTKSMMGALQLTGPHMKVFEENVKGISEHVKDGGKEIEGWKDVQGTFNQKLAEAKGHFEAMEIAMGQKLMPVAMKLFDTFNTATTWLSHHHTVLVALAGAIGGILVVGLYAAAAAAWSFAVAMLANPITWIILGIMALGAAIAVLIMHWRQVWNWIKTETPIVAKVFSAAWHGALALFHATWTVAMNAVHALVKWFNENVLTWVRARIAELVTWWKSHGKEFSETWHIIWTVIKDYLHTVITVIGDYLGIMMNAWSTVWNILWAVIQFVWTNIKNYVELGIHLVMNVIAVVMDVITGKWGKAWHDLVHLVSQVFADLNTFLLGLVTSFGQLLWDAGTALIDGLVKGVKAAGHLVLDALKGIGQSALDGFKSMFGIKSPSRVFADEVGQWIPKGIAAGIDEHAPAMLSAVGRLAGAAAGAFTVGGLEPAFAGGSASLSTGAPVVHHTHVTVNVGGSVTADRDLASTIKRVMLQDAARNSSSYTPFKR